MVTMVSMMSSQTVDILRVKPVGFPDTLKVGCERKGTIKVASRFSGLSNWKDGFACHQLRWGRLWLNKDCDWSWFGEF